MAYDDRSRRGKSTPKPKPKPGPYKTNRPEMERQMAAKAKKRGNSIPSGVEGLDKRDAKGLTGNRTFTGNPQAPKGPAKPKPKKVVAKKKVVVKATAKAAPKVAPKAADPNEGKRKASGWQAPDVTGSAAPKYVPGKPADFDSAKKRRGGR